MATFGWPGFSGLYVGSPAMTDPMNIHIWFTTSQLFVGQKS